MAKRKRKRSRAQLISFVLLVLIAAGTVYCRQQTQSATLAELPAYSGSPYVVLEENQPSFSAAERTERSFESYSLLDPLGRCGAAYANIGQDLMPTDSRGDISSVYPSGWNQAQYDCVEGGMLYNRCHLIGFQLTGENANEENLITGTRYMNVDGMLPFENQVASYIEETGNHVLYRVTPIFQGVELVARGVQMEALSVEDGGRGVCFNVYVYNVQPGVEIDYATGESCLAEETWNDYGNDLTELWYSIRKQLALHLEKIASLSWEPSLWSAAPSKAA